MIYTVSDLHGCYDKFQKLLETIKLCDDDTLYVLGDIVDRGKQSMELIKDIRIDLKDLDLHCIPPIPEL